MTAAKFVIAALTATLTALSAAISDGMIERAEWWLILIAALGAVGVYFTPNKPAETQHKPYVDQEKPYGNSTAPGED